MNIIGFSGKKGSGKSTACELLKSKSYSVVNFADTLKKEVSWLLDIPLEWSYDLEQKELKRPFNLYTEDLQVLMANKSLKFPHNLEGPSFYTFGSLREVLQWYGTDLHREASPNHWVDNLLKTLLPAQDYVIGDVRFLNEVRAIKALGGSTVLIKRPGFESNDTHTSEQTNYNTDYVIVNTELNQFKHDVLVIEALINGERQKGSFKV